MTLSKMVVVVGEVLPFMRNCRLQLLIPAANDLLSLFSVLYLVSEHIRKVSVVLVALSADWL